MACQLMIPPCLCGQEKFHSTRHHSLGGASVTLVDLFSSLENQGTLALLDTTMFGVAVRNDFFLPELLYSSIGGVLKSSAGSFGMKYSHFGTDFFSEQEIGICYGKQLSKTFYAGMRVNYFRIQQNEYGNEGVITTELGFITKMNDELSIGGHFYNPFRAKLKGKSTIQRTKSLMRVGINYQLKTCSLLAELEHSTGEELVLKSGLEYFLNKNWVLRAAYRFPRNQMSGGIGLIYKSFRLDFSYQWHTVLGSSTALGLVYVL